MSVATPMIEHMFEGAGQGERLNARDQACAPPPAGGSPAEVIAHLSTLPPSPQVLDHLSRIPVSTLDSQDAISFAAVMDRLMGWCTTLQDEALVVAAGTEPKVEVFTAGPSRVVLEDLIVEEIASALRWSSGFTSSRVAQARLLAGPLAATREAVADGHISYAHARVICAASERLPSMHDDSPEGVASFAQQCAELQRVVLPVASKGTVAQARRSADRAVVKIDARARRDVVRAGLGVRLTEDGAGISTLIARMRTVHAHACLAAIDELAADPKLEVPSDALLGERQALALACLVLPVQPQMTSEDKPRPHLRPHLEVTVSLETLVGLADEPAEFRSRRGLTGALDTWALRELLHQSDEVTLRRLVTDPVTGHLLDRGRESYRIPDSLRKFLVTRDRSCRFPGCNSRAGRGEIDHAFAWNSGGGTDRGNLGALCKRHHLVKTFGGWRIEMSQPDGSCTWHSPQARRHERKSVAIGVPGKVIPGRPPP